MGVLTISAANTINIGADVLEGGLATSDLSHLHLAYEAQAGENVGNIVEAADLGWSHTHMTSISLVPRYVLIYNQWSHLNPNHDNSLIK